MSFSLFQLFSYCKYWWNKSSYTKISFEMCVYVKQVSKSGIIVSNGICIFSYDWCSKLPGIDVASVYMPIRKVWESLFPHTLVIQCTFFLIFGNQVGKKWVLSPFFWVLRYLIMRQAIVKTHLESFKAIWSNNLMSVESKFLIFPFTFFFTILSGV